MIWGYHYFRKHPYRGLYYREGITWIFQQFLRGLRLPASPVLLGLKFQRLFFFLGGEGEEGTVGVRTTCIYIYIHMLYIYIYVYVLLYVFFYYSRIQTHRFEKNGRYMEYIPGCSMYGLFTCVWVVWRVNVGEYTIHWAFGYGTIEVSQVLNWFNF